MKFSRLVIFISFIPFVFSLSQQITDADKYYIDSLMNSYYKPADPGAVLLAAIDGKAVFRKAYGMASLELSCPNKPEYLFAIGSMSKQFAAAAILKLAGQGKLSITDDIRKYLPEYNSHGRIITIENLLSHTSGIPSYTEKSDFFKKMMSFGRKEDLLEFFMNDSLLYEPGTDWSYSNSGYVVAGMIVEKVSGMDFNKYLEENLFKPLNMKRTFIGTDRQLMPGFVSGYDPSSEGGYVPTSYLNWVWAYAAGQIVSSVDDLLLWDEAFYGDYFLSKELTRKAFTPFRLTSGQGANYGLGWAVSNYRNMQLISHGGAINGFLSDAVRIPDKHIYVVILSNNTGKNPRAFTTKIALRLSGESYALPAARILPPEKLREFTGVYEVHRAGSRLVSNMSSDKQYRYITFKNDTLYSQRTGDMKYKLVNFGDDLFVYPNSGTIARFNRNGEGKIVSLEIYNEPVNYGPNELEPLTSISLPLEKTPIILDEKLLPEFSGNYSFGGGFFINVYVDKGHIFIKPTGQSAEEIFPESETRFFLKTVDASLEFVKDTSGKVTGLTFYQGGKYEARKVE